MEERMLANSQRVEEVVLVFCDKVLELTVNENVGQLRMRITKARGCQARRRDARGAYGKVGQASSGASQ